MVQPIRFRRTTATAASRLKKPQRLARLRALALNNAASLEAALTYCATSGIGSFRVNSQILPLKTHPVLGYNDWVLGCEVVNRFRRCGELAREHGLRLTFHPDQFVVLSSPDPRVVSASIAEIEYQTAVARWINADVITVHGGGAYGDKAAALGRLERALDRLSEPARARIALENDDRVYTPEDLAPICLRAGVPLVYDVHHHRCNPDRLSVEAATALALRSWPREPLFHLSSPLQGWSGPRPERHNDFIDPRDFPDLWAPLSITVEVEAKAKELAVEGLRRDLKRRAIRCWEGHNEHSARARAARRR